MVGAHGRDASALMDAYDFSVFTKIVDVGGGNGSTLCAILDRHPDARGTLFDLPGVIARARPEVENLGLSNRVDFVAGDFFQAAPPSGADAYVLRHIIHDWDDDRARQILRNVRRAMGPDGRLLLVDAVIPPGNEPCFAKLLDLTMLVSPGGEERTAEEFAALLKTAGFRLNQIIPTATGDSIVEALPE
jgi:ubiquinone/menaquinone biosynthesis C-methylase UbiE